MKAIKGINVLERSDIERLCPSFYAEAPKFDVSEQYAFINTRDIAVQLFRNDWLLTSAREQRSNKKENLGFTKHLLRFSHPDYILDNGDRIELVAVNSHNRSKAFTLYAGIFRLVCTNGLISQTSDFGMFKIKHIGDIEEQVNTGVVEIANNTSKIASKVKQFKDIVLDPITQEQFANSVAGYMFGDENNEIPDSMNVITTDLLRPRRSIDSAGFSSIHRMSLPKPDLWTTYNVIQENALKGGIRKRQGTKRFRKTRAITNIDVDIKLNSAIWSLAESIASTKAA